MKSKKSIIKKEPKAFPFKIGADPEFNIVIQNQMVSANKLINLLYDKKQPKESNGMGYQIGTHGNIGWDGASATGEIRPSPENLPSKIVENIKKILESFVEKSGLFELSTKCDKSPVGGHIHIELNPEQINKHINRDNDILKNVHKKLSAFYIPIMLGEDAVNLRIRLKHNYGKLTDYRTQEISTNQETGIPTDMTYEFRVPSAEWLTTPRIAEGTLAYIATVYNEIINHPKSVDSCKNILFQNQKQGLVLQELALTRYIPIIKLLVQKVKQNLRSFEYYPYYKDQIDFILSPEKVLEEKKRVGFDMIRGWNLMIKSMPSKKELLTEKLVRSAALKTNMDSMINLVRLPYNNDMNCSDFSRAIQTRVVALNWRLNNNYYLYGMVPNIDNYVAWNTNGEIVCGKEQIKTVSDLASLNGTYCKMMDKFGIRTTEDKEENRKNIIIGIPYKTRINLDIKSLVKLIYEMEKNKFNPVMINQSSLINDTGKPSEERGKIWKAYNVPNESERIINMITPTDTFTSEAVRQEMRDSESY